jgi:hypothetical protein
MKQNALTLGVVLVCLISACAPQATPTANPVEVQHTAEAGAFTMVAQTLAAMPTNTPVPPTETASPTPLPTLTSVPSPTGDPLLATATTLPTSAPQSSGGSTQDNCNKTLSEWQGPTANFSIANETRPQGRITLSLYVVTELGECGYLADLSGGPIGQYSAGAFVDGRQSFKVFGGFRITEGNWKVVVRNDSIIAQGGCYPNC